MTAAIRSILHPTDFSETSHLAFLHALRLGLSGGGLVTVLHAGPEMDFPAVSAELSRWRHAVPDAPNKVRVQKVATTDNDPLLSVLDYLADHPADLLVLATHARSGLSRLLHRAVAEPLARGALTRTLFLPENALGFIDRDNGNLRLERVLIPVADHPAADAAIAAAEALVECSGVTKGTFRLLHVGTGSMPTVPDPDCPGWAVEREVSAGEPVQIILDVASGWSADVISMATEGRTGFLDALLGSTSEQVLRSAFCPVLTAPVG